MTKTDARRPSHYNYAVTKREGAEKTYWARIGAAWPNADGKGFNLRLQLLPVDGSDIACAKPRPRETPNEGPHQGSA